MRIDLPWAKHRLVSLAIMETYVRYSKVLAQYPETLRSALSFLLGEHGISHPDEVNPPRPELPHHDSIVTTSLTTLQ